MMYTCTYLYGDEVDGFLSDSSYVGLEDVHFALIQSQKYSQYKARAPSAHNLDDSLLSQILNVHL